MEFNVHSNTDFRRALKHTIIKPVARIKVYNRYLTRWMYRR